MDKRNAIVQEDSALLLLFNKQRSPKSVKSATLFTKHTTFAEFNANINDLKVIARCLADRSAMGTDDAVQRDSIKLKTPIPKSKRGSYIRAQSEI